MLKITIHLQFESLEADDGDHVPVFSRVAGTVWENDAAVTVHVADGL